MLHEMISISASADEKVLDEIASVIEGRLEMVIALRPDDEDIH